MKHLRIIVGTATLILAVSGAFFSNAATGTRKIANKPYDMTLYRTTDCKAFDCGTSGGVSCNGYDINPTSGNTPHNSASVNSLVHI